MCQEGSVLGKQFKKRITALTQMIHIDQMVNGFKKESNLAKTLA